MRRLPLEVAAMISNLMVVLCDETQATPVINTATLYQRPAECRPRVS